MKIRIGIGDRYVAWSVINNLYLLPSLFFSWGHGFIDNLDTGRIQRHLELNVYFTFLFLECAACIHLMWGDEGEVNEETFNTEE